MIVASEQGALPRGTLWLQLVKILENLSRRLENKLLIIFSQSAERGGPF